MDFDPDIGVKKSSAQITHLYTVEELKGKLAVGVVNFPPKQIGPIRSECLVARQRRALSLTIVSPPAYISLHPASSPPRRPGVKKAARDSAP